MDYDSLDTIGASCKLENFGPLTTCLLKSSEINVIFNGDSFNETETYKITILGMNNPNK